MSDPIKVSELYRPHWIDASPGVGLFTYGIRNTVHLIRSKMDRFRDLYDQSELNPARAFSDLALVGAYHVGPGLVSIMAVCEGLEYLINISS